MSITTKMRDREVWFPVLVSGVFLVLFSSGTGDPVVGGLASVIGYGVGLGGLRVTGAISSGQPPATEGEQAGVSAPFGIKALCIFCALVTVFAILLGGLMSGVGASTQDLLMGAEGFLIIGFGLVGLPVIYGLWTVTDWGWKLAMGWIGVLGIIYVVDSVLAKGADMESLILSGLSLLILLYLYSKRSLYIGAGEGITGVDG